MIPSIDLLAINYVSVVFTVLFAIYFLLLHIHGPTWLFPDRRHMMASFERRERILAIIWSIGLIFFNAILVIYRRGISLELWTVAITLCWLCVILASMSRYTFKILAYQPYWIMMTIFSVHGFQLFSIYAHTDIIHELLAMAVMHVVTIFNCFNVPRALVRLRFDVIDVNQPSLPAMTEGKLGIL